MGTRADLASIYKYDISNKAHSVCELKKKIQEKRYIFVLHKGCVSCTKYKICIFKAITGAAVHRWQQWQYQQWWQQHKTDKHDCIGSLPNELKILAEDIFHSVQFMFILHTTLGLYGGLTFLSSSRFQLMAAKNECPLMSLKSFFTPSRTLLSFCSICVEKMKHFVQYLLCTLY